MEAPSAVPIESQPEAPLWEGQPSQLLAAGTYLLCVLLAAVSVAVKQWLWVECPWAWVAAAMLVPLALAAGRFITLKAVTYRLTTQRLFHAGGVLVRKTEEVELYRVKDAFLLQPLLLRLFGVGTVVLVTTDATTPRVELRAIGHPDRVRQLIREHVEQRRVERGVREVDVE